MRILIVPGLLLLAGCSRETNDPVKPQDNQVAPAVSAAEATENSSLPAGDVAEEADQPEPDFDTEAREVVQNLVWSGFYSPSEIREILREDVYDGETVRTRLSPLIDEEVKRKTAAEHHWPETTDCDRLDAAFRRLNESGLVIALHNAGNSQSDGNSDVADEYHQRGGRESAIEGYCFYHGQDVDRAVGGQGLMLTFGGVTGNEELAPAVGQRIQKVLEQAGLEVTWDGSAMHRIEINLTWRRRSPNE